MASPSTDLAEVDTIPELVRLGEQLGQARERAGLSLEALARRLKVEPRLLQALEGGDHRQLPEGVFIVALARRIAGSLDANVEDAITNVRQSRLMDHKPPGTSPPSDEPPLSRRPQAPIPGPQTLRRPSPAGPSVPWRWPLAALLVASGAGAAWLLLQQPPGRAPSSPASPTPSSAPPVAPPVSADKPPGGGPSASQTSPNTSRAPSPTPAPSPAASDGDTLRLLASEPSWVEVRDSNGTTLFEGTLSGEKLFPIGRGLEVIAGRPYAVRAATGSTPPAPLGGVDDIRWKRFGPGAVTPRGPASSSPSP